MAMNDAAKRGEVMRIIKYRNLKSKPISEERYRALLARTEVEKAYGETLADGNGKRLRIDVPNVCEKVGCFHCKIDKLLLLLVVQ